VQLADVRDLPFEDAFFDGYWSLGVIEHFWEGYQKIQAEMRRVIKPSGFLFLTVPSMSPLRRLKAMLGAYRPLVDGELPLEQFYQFALSPEAVFDDFHSAGFEKVTFFGYDAVKGLKDEIRALKPVLQYIYDHPSRVGQLGSRAIETVMSRAAYHVGVYVLKRR
jgi:SAM-dependent methyltransferase